MTALMTDVATNPYVIAAGLTFGVALGWWVG